MHMLAIMYSKKVKQRKVPYHGVRECNKPGRDGDSPEVSKRRVPAPSCSTPSNTGASARTESSHRAKSVWNDFDFSDIKLDCTLPTWTNVSVIEGTTVPETSRPAAALVQSKGKSLWNDFDFSDIKLDSTLPTWTTVSALDASTKPAADRPVDVDDIDFDDEDMIQEIANEPPDPLLSSDCFDEDLLPVSELAEPPVLTVQDTDAMIELVKGDLVTKQNDILADEDYSRLLDDDIELYDLELSSQFDSAGQRSRFKSALGETIAEPGPELKERARSLFSDIEQILLQEMAGYRHWSTANQ